MKLFYLFATILFMLFAKETNAQSCRAAFTDTATFARCPPLIVHFFDSSTGYQLKYHWDFGDGSTDTAANPLHEYWYPGLYSVRLSILNGDSTCADTIYSNGLVHVGGPSGKFTATPDSGCVPLTVNFTANLSAVENLIVNLGDRTITDSPDVQHTYTSPGIYNVVYTIADSFGCHVAYTSDTIVVLDSSSCLSFINDIATADGEQLNVISHPVGSSLRIISSIGNIEVSSLRLCVTNLAGQVIYRRPLVDEQETIDVWEFPAGFYIVYLQSEFKVLAAARFIKL